LPVPQRARPAEERCRSCMCELSNLEVDDGHYLLGGQRWLVAVVCEKQVAREVIARLCGTCRGQFLRIFPERSHAVREANLLLRGRVSPQENVAALRASLDPGNILVRDAEDTEDDEHGELPGEISHEVSAPGGRMLIDEACGEFAHERLHGGDPPGREGDI